MNTGNIYGISIVRKYISIFKFFIRYATDKNERKDASGAPEPEVWELLPDLDRNNDSSLPPVSRRNDIAAQDTRLKSDSDDSEDEIER